MSFEHEHVRAATMEDVKFLGSRLRHEDEREVKASLYPNGAIALAEGLEISEECYVALRPDTGEPAVMFGVVRGAVGYWSTVWLMGTEDIRTYWKVFAQGSKECVAYLSEKYGAIGNWVDVRNTVHVRWLKWCGFTKRTTELSADRSTKLALYIKDW